jgi:hypothetical protein
MRQISLFFVILIAFGAPAQTNVYHPMPDSAAKWCISYAWGTNCAGYDEFTLFISGDTGVSGKQYHKLYSTGSSYCWGQPTYFTNQYKGALREDTAARKVYLLRPGYPEDLIYDLSLGVGGTCTLGNTSFIGPTYTVTSIDSVQIGASYRKRFWTNFSFGAGGGNGDTYISIIEGIGSTEGLLCEFMCQGVETGSVLNAFMENGQVDYSKNMGSCNFSAGIEVHDHLRINAFPNPTQGILKLFIAENAEELQVLNSLGEVVFLKAGALASNEELNMKGFENGIYFVRITAASGIVTCKIILNK